MKNIILIIKQSKFEEYRRRIVNKIIEDKNYSISLLIVNALTDKTYYERIPEIKHVISTLDLEYKEEINGIDYNVLQMYKNKQLLVENYFFRFFSDYQLDKYYYYTALSFWLEFFSNNQIDMVVNCMNCHGAPWDIANFVAEEQGIENYFIGASGYNFTCQFERNFKLYPAYFGQVKNVGYILESYYDKKHLPDSMIPKITSTMNVQSKSKLMKFLYSLGGNLLEDFMRRLLKWDWKPQSVARVRYKASWSEKFSAYLKMKSIEKYMLSLCQKFEDERYIFYALHFEPESSIQVRNVLENQLVIIKMIADCLPTNWKVYVKEHPSQFELNSDVGYQYLFSAWRFKSKEFYKKLAEIDGVKIINPRYTSEELIRNAKAIASISGTVLYESIAVKKPLLVFSDLHVTAYLKEVFSIHSYEECYEAINKIKEGFVPKYKDADDVIEKYVFKGEYMAENIVKLLHEKC